MSGSFKNPSEQEGAPAKAPSLIEVGTTRNEFGSLPNLQSQKNWHFALVRDGKDKTIRLKNGNRVFALRFDGDMTKDSYEKQQPIPLTRLGDLDEKDFLSGADVVSKGVFQVHRSTPNSIHGTLQDGKNNSSMIFEIGDDGKWTMHPKPKMKLSQVAAKFVSNVGGAKQAAVAIPAAMTGALIGGGIGALLDKKNRLRGGLLGAAGGGLGGVAIDGLMNKGQQAPQPPPLNSVPLTDEQINEVLSGSQALAEAQHTYRVHVTHNKNFAPSIREMGNRDNPGGTVMANSIWSASDAVPNPTPIHGYQYTTSLFARGAEPAGSAILAHSPQGPSYLSLLNDTKGGLVGMSASPTWEIKPESVKALRELLQRGNVSLDDLAPFSPEKMPGNKLINNFRNTSIQPPMPKSGSLCCPECGKPPGKYRIHGDAIQCGSCEKTSDMEKWDKTAATDDEIRKTLKVYAVDLDGTLAHNDGRDFDPDHIGKPVPGMMRLVRLWLRRGHEVRIFTARAADKKNIPRIKEWLKEHNLPDLEITNVKLPDVSEIWDDRAVQVEKNTGKKIALLSNHFKMAGGKLPNLPGITRAPAMAGEVAGAISNGTFVEGLGKGSHALERGLNSAAGVTGAIDLANTAAKVIKPLGSALIANAPAVSSGMGHVARHIAPPVWAASMAMQTGELAAHPVESATQSHQELSNTPLLGRVWAGASNPPRTIAGATKGIVDAGGAVVDAVKNNLGAPMMKLKHWYNNQGPGSLEKTRMNKSGGVIGKYLGVLRDRFTSARDRVHPAPTKLQKEKGRYRMGHVWMQGLDITIETGKGGVRSGVNAKGVPWTSTMQADYGYLRRFKNDKGEWVNCRVDSDGDHLDVFVGPYPDSEAVFVIDQNNPLTGEFDEAKVMLGFTNAKDAKQTYLDSFNKGWKGFRNLSSITIDELCHWVENGDTGKPYSTPKTWKAANTEHNIQYPKVIGDIVHSDMIAKPTIAIGSGALRGMAVASIIHALRRAKRDAFDQSHRGLSLLKDLGTGAMIGAGTGLLAHAVPPVAEKLYDTFDVQPETKLQKLSAHFMDVVLAPVNATPGTASILGAGYGALAGGAKGVYRRTKGLLTGEPPEPDAIKNDILDGMAQGANYGAYFGLTGPNPPSPKPGTKAVNTSNKLKKMKAVIPPRR